MRMRWFVLSSVVLYLSGCVSKPTFQGFDYDPPGATDTRLKPIYPPSHHVFKFDKRDLIIRSDFAAGRLSGARMLPDSVMQLIIRPEFYPVNNSPWYAFAIESKTARSLSIHLTYEGGRHRYWPKISKDGKTWEPMPKAFAQKPDSTLRFTLPVEAGKVWISAQEIRDPRNLKSWMETLPRETVQRRVAGRSRNRNPIHLLRVGSAARPNYRIVIVGRQHPPEVPGDLALEYFVKTLATDQSDTAKKFRALCEVLVLPMLNPDGVINGHWRLNAGGADLNRDWGLFNQTETRVARRVFTRYGRVTVKTILSLDFHATGENIFYPINADIEKPNGAIVDEWIDRISVADPAWKFKKEPFDLTAPIFKNWACLNLGCDGLTYEVGDKVKREDIQRQSVLAARLLMALILEKYGQAPMVLPV
jgi:hypothetical protein